MERKRIIDTTFRDGQQSPLLFDAQRWRFNEEQKTILMTGLLKLGVRHFELFSGVVNNGEQSDFEVLESLARAYQEPVHLLAHVRCHPKDVEAALQVNFDGLNMYMGVSDKAQQSSHGKNLDTAIMHIRSTIEQIRHDHPDLYIRFSGEDAFSTPIENLYRVYDAIADSVDTFGFPDTVGKATPMQVIERVRLLRQRYPSIDLEGHFHNDRQFAMINAYVAALEGVKYIDATVWGIAERQGIPSVTGLLLNLYEADPDGTKGYVDGYVLEHAYPLNVILADILDMYVPWTEPVSLTGQTDIAGVHVNASLKDPTLYHAHNLEKFGVDTTVLLLGPLSGKYTYHYYLNEIAGYKATLEQSQHISQLLKTQTHRLSFSCNPLDLLMEIAEAEQLEKIEIPVEERARRIENVGGGIYVHS